MLTLEEPYFHADPVIIPEHSVLMGNCSLDWTDLSLEDKISILCVAKCIVDEYMQTATLGVGEEAQTPLDTTLRHLLYQREGGPLTEEEWQSYFEHTHFFPILDEGIPF